MPAELAMVIETGRRHQIDVAMICQAPNLIHNRVRLQMTECVTFFHADENAQKWLVSLGMNESELKSLGQNEFIAFNLISRTSHKETLRFN